MDYVRWKDELSVGNLTIDNEHKELFRLINAFYNSIVGNSGKTAIIQAILDMERYIKVHFTAEEEMMRRAAYPEYNFHKAEHQKFVDTVADFKKRYEEGRLLLSLEVSGFVKNWITEHIMKTDHRYIGQI
jgi:hemerythrin